MKLADQYDVICAGGGLSSYLCAALLAKSGKKTLVIDEQPEDPGSRFGTDPLVSFDSDFSFFTGLSETSALGKSLTELGISKSDRDFIPLDAIGQVLTSDYRVTFWKEKDLAQKELKRELREFGSAISDFFSLMYRAGHEIPSFSENALTFGQAGAKEVADWKKFWAAYLDIMGSRVPVPLRDTLPSDSADACVNLASAVMGSVSYVTPKNLGFEQAIRGLSILYQGQGYYVGGIHKLKLHLSEIIKANGGAVKKNAAVEALISEKDKITGVLLSSFEGIIRGNYLILTTRLKRMYASLPPHLQDLTVLRGLNKVVPTHWRFTLGVALRREGIPIGATSNMTYVGSYHYPLEEENFLRLQVLPSTSDKNDSDENCTVLVTALVPYRASSMDYSYLRKLAGRMLMSMSNLIPFLSENIKGIYPDFRTDEKSLKSCYPFRGLDWVPENLLQYYVHGHRVSQDFWGPSWSTPHSNLYFAGRSIWPSLGLYGEALTARKIYDDLMLLGGRK